MDMLNKRVLSTVSKSGLDYFHFTENDQVGTCFGVRFSNAISAIFQKGYENIITIGNDTPQLQLSHIHKAAAFLNNGESVVGPSVDGGFYLMGISYSQFDKASFKNLPWQSSQLASCYLKSLDNKNLSYQLLESLIDFDTVEDVRQFLNGKDQRDRLVQQILRTLSQVLFPYTIRIKETVSVSISLPLNKGSPLAA